MLPVRGEAPHTFTIGCHLAVWYLYRERCPFLYHCLSSGGMLPVRGVVPHPCTTICPLTVCYLNGEWCPIFVPLAVLWWYVTCTGSGAPSLYQWLSASSMLPVRGAVPHLCTTGCPLAAWRPPGRPAPGSPRHSGFWWTASTTGYQARLHLIKILIKLIYYQTCFI